MIKLIVCDLDGTVFNDKKEIDSGLKEVVEKLKKQGVLFTVASGRNNFLFTHVIDELNVELPYISNNGAEIFRSGECIIRNTVPNQYNNYVAKLLYDNDLVYRVYCTEEIFTHGSSEFFNTRHIDHHVDYDPSIDLTNNNIIKITVDHIYNPNQDFIKKEIESHCEDVLYTKAEDHVYCVNNAYANKGDALLKVCELINIDPKEVMAFGDNDNDAKMLKNAGVAVAMGNAEDSLKNIADYVCLDNNHNGISNFLIDYFKL